MKNDSLTKFTEEIRQIWGPLDSNLIIKSQVLLEELVRAPLSEPWLAELQGDLNESLELYRDPEHGFILLAHTEREGMYRDPHDHGSGWVIYAVQRGKMQMATYGRIEREDGFKIVKRDKYLVDAGESRVYLPGDIHDTRCVSNSVLMLRLTSHDLKKELQAGRMHRFPKVD
jgi:hypothetical protein